MTTLQLDSGVRISTDNASIIQQYLKYGAVEVGAESTDTTASEDPKPRKTKK